MSSLITFGCSFTHGFSLEIYPNGPSMMMLYYRWRNETLPKIWPEIVAENLGLELVNFGYPGSSCYKIFESFCNNSHIIKRGDVVIFEWTRIHRFRMRSSTDLPTILPIFNSDDNGRHPIKRKSILEIQVNRTEKSWVNELYAYQNFIIEYCNSIGAEVYFWSADDYIINSENRMFKIQNRCLLPESNYDMMSYLRNNYGAKTIRDETDGIVTDEQHYGEVGHKVMGEIFTKELMRYRNL